MTIIRHLILAVAALPALSSVFGAEPQTTSSVRSPEQSGFPENVVMLAVTQSGKERLKTPVARYMNAEGRTVDLVGAVHLGDDRYYKNLNRAFARYDKVLYEMVDGEDLPEMTRIARKVKAGTATPEELARHEKYLREKESGGMASRLLGGYYSYVAELTQLSLQSDVVDYGLDNLVYADMSMDEFRAAMAERGESWMTLLWDGLSESSFSDATSGGLASDPQGLRRRIAQVLVQGARSGSRTEQRAIIVSRNARCFEVLDHLLASDAQARRVAIFYGAMHLRDMHARLLERGFTLQGVQWITAITVN